MATNKVRNPVEDDANWKKRVETEYKRAKGFEADWGSLGTPSETRDLGHDAAPAKYFNKQGLWTVKRIRVPEKEGGRALPDVKPEQLADPQVFPGTSRCPGSAMDSVVLSNTITRQCIQDRNPFFVPTSTTYGSRMSLEQFGIAEHAIRHHTLPNGK